MQKRKVLETLRLAGVVLTAGAAVALAVAEAAEKIREVFPSKDEEQNEDQPESEKPEKRVVRLSRTS